MPKLHSLIFIIILTIFSFVNVLHLTNQSLVTPLNEWNRYSIAKSTIPKQPSTNIPVYSVYLSDPPEDRYRQISSDKKALLGQFIDYLYQIQNFKYSMWIAKALFLVLPEYLIRNHLGAEFYDQCKGIALHSGRQLYQIVVYNYMYEIGAAKDFCTSIAITQTRDDNYRHKQNLSLLARNLDYGFQKFLVQNTVRINFYQSKTSDKLLFTTIAHAGFVSSHTVLKYETSSNMQFGLTLNQRKSQNFASTLHNIILTGCESVFQLTNRLLATDVSTTEQLIELVANSRSCSKFYFIIQVKDGDHVVIQKNEGVGAHRVYFDKEVDFDEDPFFVVQTNTDRERKDPDGRRDQAIGKINKVIEEKGYLQKEDLKRVLLEAPNFNDQTLMTALIDVEKGQIEAMVWDIDVKNSSLKGSQQKNEQVSE